MTKLVTMSMLLLVVGAPAARADGPKTAPAAWYAADSDRIPRVAIDHALTPHCPQIEAAIAIAKYTLLNGSMWVGAKAPPGIDLTRAREGVAALLDDPKLNIRWNPKQVPLAQLPADGRSAAGETLDKHTVQLNEIACKRRLDDGKIVARSAHEIAKTVVHELLHVWGERNGVGTADGLLGVGVAYDFEALLPSAPFSDEAVAEMGAVAVSGKWQSDWGPVTIVADGGANVSGWWDQAVDRIGRITGGTYDPATRTLTFTYYEDWAKLSGSATLVLKPGGRALDGTWTQPNGAGSWTMKR